MNIEYIIKIVSTDCFANIATAISAIGTIAAVIVSLYLSRKGDKIKYKIQRKITVPLNVACNCKLLYDVELINLTRNNQIIISSFPYIRAKNKNVILKNYMPIYESNEDSYTFPRKLNYGDNFIVSIDKRTTSELLSYSNNKKFILIIQDVLGQKYKYKIKRKELELIVKNSQ